MAGRLLEFGEELRGEGVAVGTSELLDAFEVLREVPWTRAEDFREGLAATLAKSQEDRRVFDLVFDRVWGGPGCVMLADENRLTRGVRRRCG